MIQRANECANVSNSQISFVNSISLSKKRIAVQKICQLMQILNNKKTKLNHSFYFSYLMNEVFVKINSY